MKKLIRTAMPYLGLALFIAIGTTLQATDSKVMDMQKRDLGTGNNAILKTHVNNDGTVTLVVLAVIVTPTPSSTNTPTPTSTPTPSATSP